MAKKQTRRSISVSRMTYERLKAFCETNSISMSQLVETRVNDFLGSDVAPPVTMTMSTPGAQPAPVRPVQAMAPRPMAPPIKPVEPRPVAAPVHATPSPSSAAIAGAPAAHPAAAAAAASQPAPMTSAAARFAVEPPLPIIRPRQETAAPAPAEKRPEQIFTF